ncbi:MAG TPA: hypothetical protein VLC98_10945 [Phnomibacter sp.]|nr:hypothetical protein [Phnomibacter sp.]
MEKQPFKNMDELMRDAVRWEDEPAYSETHWAALEEALSRQKKKPRFGWWWTLIPVALVAGFFLYPTVHDNSKKETKPVVTKQELNEVPAVEEVKPSTVTAGQNSETINDDLALQQQADQASAAISMHMVLQSHSNNNVVSNRQNENRENNEIANQASKQISKEEQKNETVIGNSVPSKNLQSNDSNFITVQENKTVADQQAKNEIVTPAIANATGEKVNEEQASAKNAKTKKPTAPVARGFYIQPSVGIEWSKVKSNEMGKTALSYGALGGYQFNEKFAVQTGVFVTEKLYDAGSEDYYFAPGSYYTQVKVHKVEAECRVLEIPVLAKYTVLRSTKNNLAIGLGFNNSVMLQEDYDIHYTRMNGDYSSAYKTFKTGKAKLFSGIIFETDYTHVIGKRLSLSAAPQLKIATSGVGEGLVKINSFGLLGGIRIKL